MLFDMLQYFEIIQFLNILKCFYVTGRAKSPTRPKPSYEEITPEVAYKPQSYEPKKAAIVPGDLPKFKVRLPKVVELEEGDRLKLEASADGLPKPHGNVDLPLYCVKIKRILFFFSNL